MYQYFDKIRPDETSARLRTQNKLIAKLKAEKLRQRCVGVGVLLEKEDSEARSHWQGYTHGPVSVFLQQP